MQFSVADAKNKLPELIKAVEAGETVTICRRGVAVVVDIVRTGKQFARSALGALPGADQKSLGWKPMTDKEAEDFLAGRY